MKCKIGFEDGEFLFVTKPETEDEKRLMDSCFEGKPLDSFEADCVINKVHRKKNLAIFIIFYQKE